MAKKTQFPVKSFRLTGATVTEKKITQAVRQARTATLGKAKNPAKKVSRSETASGSGKIKFAFDTYRTTKTGKFAASGAENGRARKSA